jgi:hypothetical protein
VEVELEVKLQVCSFGEQFRLALAAGARDLDFDYCDEAASPLSPKQTSHAATQQHLPRITALPTLISLTESAFSTCTPHKWYPAILLAGRPPLLPPPPTSHSTQYGGERSAAGLRACAGGAQYDAVCGEPGPERAGTPVLGAVPEVGTWKWHEEAQTGLMRRRSKRHGRRHWLSSSHLRQMQQLSCSRPRH